MTTHWSVVGDFSLEETAPDRAEAALTRLCRDYWPPLYRFVRQRGYSRDDARDLTQGFFAYLMEKKAYSTPDRSKGRFRTFLLVLLKRYLGATAPISRRQKRGGEREDDFPRWRPVRRGRGADGRGAATRAPLDEERCFEWNWAAALVGRAMEALSAEYRGGQRRGSWPNCGRS